MNLKQLQKHNQVKFKNVALLQQAMTHRSYVNEHEEEDLIDNERLEFLGDAVLDLLAGDMLYSRFAQMPEGDLTRFRAALVRTEALAALAQDCRIGEALRMGKGEENTGGRERANNLCGAFEAFIGAMYLDHGLEVVRDFMLPHLNRMLERVMAESLDKDARSQLQEWSQATFNLTPNYRLVSASGPEHEKQFTVEVVLGETVVGTGVGRSKQAASQAAAQTAYRSREQIRLDDSLSPAGNLNLNDGHTVI
jgi:ribonuclease III